MKLTIIETGLVPEPIRADFADYPEMFRNLISAADPDIEYETVSVIHTPPARALALRYI